MDATPPLARARATLGALRRSLERRLLPPVMPDGDDAVWTNLAYLGFLFIPGLMDRFAWTNWPLTFASVPVFLLLYFASFWAKGWARAATALAVALLATALFPANPFANTYTIYACVMAATLPRRQAALVFVLAQLLLLGALIATTPSSIIGFVAGMTLLISATATLATRFYVAKAREQRALRLSQEEIRRLAQVAERERIGRDLHDLLGHTLSVIALKAELATRLAPRDAEAAHREMAEVTRVAREALAQVRRAVTGMRALGLKSEFANARLALSAAAVEFEYDGGDIVLAPETETVLALALREAVTNVVRHAGAHRCHARLARDAAAVTLEIADDGRGGTLREGSGLSGMRERVEAAGGSLGVESSTAGTTLRIRLPWREPELAPEAPGRGRPPLRAVR